MRICDLTNWLETQFPPKAAEEWDNVGLLVGDDTVEVERVFLALDATQETIAQAAKFHADLLLTHHPMIFGGVKKINNHTDTGRKILSLIDSGIACYAMHTNYDIYGMADLSADLLNLENPQVLAVTGEDEDDGQPIGFGRVGDLSKEMTLAEFGQFVRICNGLPDVRIYGDPDTLLHRAAICTGSGKSFLSDALRSGAQVYVTGDVDYHTALDAVADGLCIVDAGHYGTEYIFMDEMEERLERAFPGLIVGKAKVQQPYMII